jgi:uncharacterized membrane protein YcaP (DUF421 family)
MFDLDWHSMFALKGSFLDPVVRGSIMYLGMFILLRVFRRQSGSVGIADLLFIVVIADAAQNGMAGDTKSVTEAGILIGTIIFWDYAIDWLGFRSPILGRILEPDAVILIKDGPAQRIGAPDDHRRGIERPASTSGHRRLFGSKRMPA